MSSRCGISGKKFNEEKLESPDGDSDGKMMNDK
jgi:hypothetical protein